MTKKLEITKSDWTKMETSNFVKTITGCNKKYYSRIDESFNEFITTFCAETHLSVTMIRLLYSKCIEKLLKINKCENEVKWQS